MSAGGAGDRAQLGVRGVLLVAVLLLVTTGNPPRAVIGWLAVVILLLVVSVRRDVALLAVIALFVSGIHLRFAYIGTSYSDVLPVTSLAIERVLAGGNPYGSGYANSLPPGAPFAYGPLSLLWYLPAAPDPRRLELLVSLGLLAVFAFRGRLLGLAVYALATPLLQTAADGSNDTSAGLFLLVALLVALRVPRAGAFLLAVAVAFKPYAAAWLPPLVRWAGPSVVVPFAVGAALLWGPAVAAYGPGAILESFRLAETIHPGAYYSLAYLVETVPGQLASAPWALIRLAVGGLAAALTWPFATTGLAMIVAGALIYLATLYGGYWASYAYLAALSPIVCWHLDRWLGLERLRVRWPGDPVAELEAWADRRWPAHDAAGRAEQRDRLGAAGA